MRIAFSAPKGALFFFLCLHTLGSAPQTISLPGQGVISAQAGPHGPLLNIKGLPHVDRTLPLPVDDTVRPGSIPALKLTGENGPNVLLLEDTYYSRSGGLSNCQAGKEQFLRVIALGQPNRQMLRLKLSSCVENIELTDPGVKWDLNSGSLEVNWLPNPAASSALTQARYQISKQGTVKLLR